MERRQHLLQGWNLAALPAATLMKRNMRSETIINHAQPNSCGPGSVVGIATGYGLDGLGIESRWEEGDFPHLSRPALGPIQPPLQWVPGLSRGNERPGRNANPSPPSSAVVMKE
jgi:hypothetical protein